MKKTVRYFGILLILQLMLTFQSKSQVYPVQLNAQLIPPYSLKLSDYVAPGTNRAGLNMILTDLNKPEYYVRLELTIEGDGITIKTSPTFNPGPVILEGGVPQFLTSSGLAPYFNPQNLDFSGYSKSDYLASGSLPEGIYRFSFRAYDYNKGVRVSNNSSITAWLLLNEPPIINLPLPNHKVEHIDPQNIVFQWTPRHTGSPNSAFTTEYEFTLVEIWPEGRDPNNAIQTSIPFYQTTTTNNSLVYGLSETFLEPGRKYAYRIQARDTDGRDMFKNNGYSEVRIFTFGDECKLATNLQADAYRFNEAEISWQPAFTQTAFNVRYRKANDPDAEWFEEETFIDHLKITGLEEATEYEYQVMGYCGTYEGDYTDTKTFTTPVPNIADFECGAGDDGVSISNHEPLPVLQKGDYIHVGNFMVKIAEATGSNGTFSGQGFAMIPYLGFVKLLVEFENIKVNTDNQVWDGSVRSVYVPDSPFFVDLDETLGDDDEDEDTGGDDDDSGGDDTDDTGINDTTVNTVVDSVYIVEDEDIIVIINDDGTTDTIPNTDDIIITDENGDTWVVDDGVITPPGGGEDNPDSDDDTEEAEGKILVTFVKYNEQQNGFDPYDKELKSMFSPPYDIGGEEYFAPWKSLKEGSTDYVNAVFELEDTTYKPEDIKFRTATGIDLNAQEIPDSDERKVFLYGQVDETEDEVMAYVTETDTAGNEIEHEVGKLRIISYSEEQNQMRIVPVNMDKSEVNLASLSDKINKIYRQSVVNWNITIDDRFDINTEDWDRDINGLLDDSESGMFANYTKEMNKIIRKYKKTRDADKNTYYVLLLGNITPESGDLAGYMPFKQQFGLIFIPVTGKDESHLARIVSHEIGHGAFRLYHTFSDRSTYIRSQGTTNNLMDYNNGTHLNKYQWIKIHNPKSMIAWTLDDDESELTWTFIDRKHTLLLNHIYENNKIINLAYSNKIQENSNEESINLIYEDEEAEKWSDEEKTWIDQWDIGTYDGDKISESIINKIQSANGGEKIETITLEKDRIYIGKYTIDDKDYPVAIYSKKKTLDNLTKIQITDLDDLTNDENRKHFYCDEGIIKYFIIAFYEEGNETPSLIMQIEKFNVSEWENTKKKWLEYLGILLSEEEEEETKDIMVNAIWISQFSSEINGRACHWCGELGKCCNGGKACSKCPNDDSKECCEVECNDTTLVTDCDTCSLGTLCKTKYCRSNNCCYQASLAIIEKFNVTTDRTQSIDIATLISDTEWSLQSDLQSNLSLFELSISYIDKSLKAGKPIVIGVHYNNNYPKTYNTNKATFHFMVIIGKIYKNDKVYYRFYDPGRTNELNGKSENNLLKIDNKQNLIYGDYRSKTYTVTEVRKNF